MTILRLVKFGRRIETLRTRGQRLLKELIQHIKTCDLQMPMAVLENPEDDLRFIVAGNEIRLALEIKARTAPESLEGNFVTYLVTRDQNIEVVRQIGKVWRFGEEGNITDSTPTSFPHDFVQNLKQSVAHL